MVSDRSVKERNRHTCLSERVDIGKSASRTSLRDVLTLLFRCVGETFAYLQLSVIISYLVRNFEIEAGQPEFPQTDYQVSKVSQLDKSHWNHRS
jgi:hypothetical protein